MTLPAWIHRGVEICVKQAPEFTLDGVLAGIKSQKYVCLANEKLKSFVLLEMHHDEHFNCRVLNILLAYSPPEVKGFMESIAPAIDQHAKLNKCKKIICQAYADGYQTIIEAGKQCSGVEFTPYMWRYELSLKAVQL